MKTARTTRQMIEGMALVFDPTAAGDLTATIQFEISGAEPGVYHLDIAGGECRFHPGPARDASLVLTTPSEVWERISAGSLSGRDALLDGLYQVRGDASLLTRMDRLFGRPPEDATAAPATRRRPGPIVLTGSRWLTVAFLPWLVLWFGPLFGVESGAGVLVAFALSASLGAYHAVFDRATWFELGSAIFLGLGAAASVMEPARSALPAWSGAADNLVLGFIWLFSLLHGPHPLTAEYSRWDHAESLSRNSTFLHVNRVLTLMWGVVFVAMGSIAIAARQWPEAAGALGLLRFALPIPAILATIRLPRVAARMRIENVEGWQRRARLAALAGVFAAIGVLVTAALTFR